VGLRDVCQHGLVHRQLVGRDHRQIGDIGLELGAAPPEPGQGRQKFQGPGLRQYQQRFVQRVAAAERSIKIDSKSDSVGLCVNRVFSGHRSGVWLRSPIP